MPTPLESLGQFFVFPSIHDNFSLFLSFTFRLQECDLNKVPLLFNLPLKLFLGRQELQVLGRKYLLSFA